MSGSINPLLGMAAAPSEAAVRQNALLPPWLVAGAAPGHLAPITPTFAMPALPAAKPAAAVAPAPAPAPVAPAPPVPPVWANAPGYAPDNAWSTVPPAPYAPGAGGYAPAPWSPSSAY